MQKAKALIELATFQRKLLRVYNSSRSVSASGQLFELPETLGMELRVLLLTWIPVLYQPSGFGF